MLSRVEQALTARVAAALRSPYVPDVFNTLEGCGYLGIIWPQLEPSVETAGFLASALYMADMATDAVADSYGPPDSRLPAPAGLDAVLDVFHWVQPQTLLLCAALAEAWRQPVVGGQGSAEPRITSATEQMHLSTAVALADAQRPHLPAIARALQATAAPELYRAVATWPDYLAHVWGELEHLPSFPPLRRRARALYYYARSSARFLAVPLEGSEATLRSRGLSEEALAESQSAIEAVLPLTAVMMVHCAAMRSALGITERLLPPRT